MRVIGDTLPGVDVNTPLLEVDSLRVEFKVRGKLVPAVRGASFTASSANPAPASR
jgi:peptide/nickel transport system ATP-binding protein/oligopeptide transport system ATP-binding protein